MMENLLDCDGYRFECLIQGDPVVGHISVNAGKVFLCQDSKPGISDGCGRTFGHRCCWLVYEGSASDLDSTHVSDFHLLVKLDNGIYLASYSNWQVGDVAVNGVDFCVVIYRSGPLVAVKDRYEEDVELYTCRGLYDAGFRLYLGNDFKNEPLVTVTLKEIAAWKGVDVSRIKVKG